MIVEELTKMEDELLKRGLYLELHRSGVYRWYSGWFSLAGQGQTREEAAMNALREVK